MSAPNANPVAGQPPNPDLPGNLAAYLNRRLQGWSPYVTITPNGGPGGDGGDYGAHTPGTTTGGIHEALLATQNLSTGLIYLGDPSRLTWSLVNDIIVESIKNAGVPYAQAGTSWSLRRRQARSANASKQVFMNSDEFMYNGSGSGGGVCTYYCALESFSKTQPAITFNPLLQLEAGAFGGSVVEFDLNNWSGNAGNASCIVTNGNGNTPIFSYMDLRMGKGGSQCGVSIRNDTLTVSALRIWSIPGAIALDVNPAGALTYIGGVPTTGKYGTGVITGPEDIRKGVASADPSPTTVCFANFGPKQLLRLSARIFGASGMISSAVYTLTWTESSTLVTRALRIGAVGADAEFSGLIQPDAGTDVKAQLTMLAGSGHPTVNVSCVTELISS